MPAPGLGAARAPAPGRQRSRRAASSSRSTTTRAATSRPSSAGARTTGPTMRSRTSIAGRSCMRSAADDEILRLYLTAGEGMIRQYSEAKTTDVPAGRDGMYVKEFSAQSDWMHHGEGLQLFNRMALSAPDLPAYRDRVRRFAALYMGEDPARAELRPGEEADSLDDQRQPRPDAAAGDGARLGRRSVRHDRLRRAARREHVRAVPRALPGIHRRRRRSLPEPRRHDAARPTRSWSPARRSTAAGSSSTWTRGWRA